MLSTVLDTYWESCHSQETSADVRIEHHAHPCIACVDLVMLLAGQSYLSILTQRLWSEGAGVNPLGGCPLHPLNDGTPSV